MSTKNISKQNNALHGKTDWNRLKSITEKDIVAGAKSDPDAPLLTQAELAEFKREREPKTVLRAPSKL